MGRVHRWVQACECGHRRPDHKNWKGKCKYCDCKRFRRKKS